MITKNMNRIADIDDDQFKIFLRDCENQIVLQELMKLPFFAQYLIDVDIISIEELKLSTRTFNSLRNMGVRTVNDLLKKTVDDLLNTRNVGVRAVSEINAALERHTLPTFRIPERHHNSHGGLWMPRTIQLPITQDVCSYTEEEMKHFLCRRYGFEGIEFLTGLEDHPRISSPRDFSEAVVTFSDPRFTYKRKIDDLIIHASACMRLYGLRDALLCHARQKELPIFRARYFGYPNGWQITLAFPSTILVANGKLCFPTLLYTTKGNTGVYLRRFNTSVFESSLYFPQKRKESQ
ncbi:hypothetical protein HY620_02380 [Candidatus Uhrbacteria bacterium]|nr:hypothetical protein [Candidatus Uhrbacteria bacterium]